MAEIIIPSLEPGQDYVLQVRVKGDNGLYSAWSTVYELAVTSDINAPSVVTGLDVIVSGTSFSATWTKPTTDDSGGVLKDFKDYKVTVSNGVIDSAFYVAQERFDVSLELNKSIFNAPSPTITITVQARDITGNLSDPVSDSATNAAPIPVANLNTSEVAGGVAINWDASTEGDIKQYEVYVGTDPAFIPDATNIRYSGTSTSFIFTSTSTALHYFKVRAVDIFNQGSTYEVVSAIPTPIGGGDPDDTTPPSQPSAPTVSTDALVAQVSHNMTIQGGGDLEDDVDYLEVHASTTTGFTPDISTLQGTIDSAGLGIDVSAAFYFPVTTVMTDLFWKVIAVDRSKNKSIASNQTTGLPGLIQSINILDATITNAKIQSLSAAKLEAGTAIVNDLTVSSVLTVDTGGEVRSSNFSSGISGWSILADGSVEFNNGTFRGTLNISNTYATKQFNLINANLSGVYRYGPTKSITGTEPTIHMKGWLFGTDPSDTIVPLYENQSVIRMIPNGQLQMLYDPSWSTRIFDTDGNNLYDSSGIELNIDYGSSEFRLGSGANQDNFIKQSDPVKNTYFAYGATLAVLKGSSTQAGKSGTYEIKVADGTQNNTFDQKATWEVQSSSLNNGFTSKNSIADTMDIFDNAGGTTYYNSNTYRNRVVINSVDTNFWAAGKKTWNSLNLSLNSSGAGASTIYFAPNNTTYAYTVIAGQKWNMSAWFANNSSGTMQARVVARFNNGSTFTGAWRNINDGYTGLKGFPYGYLRKDDITIPLGSTSMQVGFEFTTPVTTQAVWLGNLQLIKYLNPDGTLANAFNEQAFLPVGASFTSAGASRINFHTSALSDEYQVVDAAKEPTGVGTAAAWTIDLEDLTRIELKSGRSGSESSVAVSARGFKWGTIPEGRPQAGIANSSGSGQVINTGTSGYVPYDGNQIVSGTDSMGRSHRFMYNEAGSVFEAEPGKGMKFIAMRAGIYSVAFTINIQSPPSASYYLELWNETTNTLWAVVPAVTGIWTTSLAYTLPLSYGDRISCRVNNNTGSTITVNFSRATFAQII